MFPLLQVGKCRSYLVESKSAINDWMNVVLFDRLIHVLKILRIANFHAANRRMSFHQGQRIDRHFRTAK